MVLREVVLGWAVGSVDLWVGVRGGDGDVGHRRGLTGDFSWCWGERLGELLVEAGGGASNMA